MDTWMDDMVCMMSEGVGHSTVQVKKEFGEVVAYQAASPAPSCTALYSPSNDVAKMEFNESYDDGGASTVICGEPSPGSPDRQFCSSTTQSIADSNQQECLKEESPRRLCLVCGDVASGFHYGVASCEACKAFFKRTIQGNIEYTCPAANDCEINKRRRKACQACRFQKCLLMGMLKEGVRLDRVRGGRQKYRRNPDTPYQMQVVHPLIKMNIEDIKILEVLSTYEPEPLQITENSCTTEANTKTLTILSDLYDRELVGIIGWAKQIPGFTDLLLNDQMRLLQSSWVELLTLMLAHRSLPATPGGPVSTTSSTTPMGLNFAVDLTLDERLARECGALELYQHVMQVIGRLQRLNTSREEYFLLKALVLANSDARLDEPTSLRKFRDTILSALSDCVTILRPANSTSQLQQLLLVLPSLRQADHVVRRFWSGVHREGKIPMNKLFVEMLEAVTR